MSDNSELLKFLTTAQSRYEQQQNVLWKVETHYTWFVYIIAGAVAYVLLKTPLELSQILVPIFGGVGIIMSIIGYYVIRLEGEYLAEDSNIYNKTLNELPTIRSLHPCQEQEYRTWPDTRVDANKSFFLLLASFILHVLPLSLVYMFVSRKISIKMSDSNILKKMRIGVRDLFQITMLYFFCCLWQQ